MPERLRAPLVRCANGDLPANIALMQLLMGAHDEAEARGALDHVLAEFQAAGRGADVARIGRIAETWQRAPAAWSIVTGVLGRIRHDEPAVPADDAIARCAAMFDAAAEVSVEASVALYALGDAALLSAATNEIVMRFREWGLLGPDRRLLDLGCGIGRLLVALAPSVRSVVGIDIAPALLREARRRSTGFSNAAPVRTSGRDLAAFSDASLDLVYAVDSFPYLVQAGPEIAARHIAEAARVLVPGGALLIFNYSYRGDLERDRAEIAQSAAAHGLALCRNGTRDFGCWDGVTFDLRRPV